MSHPATGEKIYIFADVLHLLKQLRNQFFDKGFISKDSIFRKHSLECLIDNANTEISSSRILLKLHLTCKRAQKQNIKLAAQLFSRTTANALKSYLPRSDTILAKKKFRILRTCEQLVQHNELLHSISVDADRESFWGIN